MTTYNAPSYTLNKPSAYHGQANNLQVFRDVVTISAAQTTADGGTFGYLPPNAVVVGGYLKASDMDTGSATLTIDVGVTGAAQQFFAASTAGQAGTVDSTMAATGRGYKNTSGAKIAITWACHANPATGVAGTLELQLTYYIEDLTTTGV